MNSVDPAAALTSAEGALRKLIVNYAERGEYAKAAEAAQVADRLLAVISGLASDVSPSAVSTAVSPEPTQTKYPHFVKEGERLVKVGWSKANNQRYEHKAGFAVVRIVANEIGRAAQRSKRINFTELPPLRLGKSDIPSYQTYLCLAWLNSAKLLRKVGRDTYVIDNPESFNAAVIDAWDRLPNRA